MDGSVLQCISEEKDLRVIVSDDEKNGKNNVVRQLKKLIEY